MIEINGLTTHQKDMLVIMWSLDSEEEYIDWYNCLDGADQKEADVLMRMIILASLDNMHMEDDLTQARMVLSKYRLH